MVRTRTVGVEAGRAWHQLGAEVSAGQWEGGSGPPLSAWEQTAEGRLRSIAVPPKVGLHRPVHNIQSGPPFWSLPPLNFVLFESELAGIVKVTLPSSFLHQS